MSNSSRAMRAIRAYPDKTAMEIAKIANVSVASVYMLAKRRGIKFRKKVVAPPTVPEDIKAIAPKLAFPVKRVFGKSTVCRGYYDEYTKLI